MRPGHKTQAWWVQANAGRLIPPEDLCWSLVCKDRTLDLAAEDGEDAKAWRRGLRGAIQVLQTARRKRFNGEEDNATVDSDDEEVRSVASDSLLGSPRHDVAAPRFRLALERGDCVAARRLLAAAKVNGGDAVLANRSYGTDTGAKMETPLHGIADGQRFARPIASGAPRRRAGEGRHGRDAGARRDPSQGRRRARCIGCAAGRGGRRRSGG